MFDSDVHACEIAARLIADRQMSGAQTPAESGGASRASLGSLIGVSEIPAQIAPSVAGRHRALAADHHEAVRIIPDASLVSAGRSCAAL